MDFRTPVALPAEAPTISPSTHALVLGSCFAEHIGERLRLTLGAEQCCVNPFGVLYNPMSIAQALQLILALPSGHDGPLPSRIDDAIFEGRDALWHSWFHSTHYSATTREECRSRCLVALTEARRILDRADLLIVTFGTSRCYSLADGTVVANCHKELPTTFTERDCTVGEIVGIWRPLLERLHQLRPGLKVVFTVSPYRYRKYGFHASQLAKARLLLATDELGETYFPAYEIVLDELRDYRFYKPDMLHPSEQAVDYIWERFQDWCFSPETKQLYQQHIKQQKALNHHANH